MTRILLIGSGMTSSVTGAILRHELPTAELIFWDKARGIGGRMSSFRNANDETATLDLGAQYISTTSDYAQLHSSYYKELEDAGILRPLTAKFEGMKTSPEGTNHYVFPKGSSSLVKYFLSKSKSEIRFNHHVDSIQSSGKRWEVCTQTGEKDLFDVVVLTMPVPQILGLSGNIRNIIKKNETLHKNLLHVDYSSRFALGLFFSKGSNVTLQDGNTGQYISDDPIVRFVCIDSAKRESDSSPSVVIHTSVPYGKVHIEKTPAEIEPSLLKKVLEMFPEWPKPEFVKCHKWRYSQVTTAFPGLPGAVSLDAGLIAGGDGFTHSNMDGCIESAKAVAEHVLRHINTSAS